MESKLIVKWDKELQGFHVTHPYTDVIGFGTTISMAIDNWIWWYHLPY